MIIVRYFASIREQLGIEKEQITLNKTPLLADVITLLKSREDLWNRVLGAPNVQIALNQVQVSDTNQKLQSGDEIAFLPPVTGG